MLERDNELQPTKLVHQIHLMSNEIKNVAQSIWNEIKIKILATKFLVKIFFFSVDKSRKYYNKNFHCSCHDDTIHSAWCKYKIYLQIWREKTFAIKVLWGWFFVFLPNLKIQEISRNCAKYQVQPLKSAHY